MAQDVDILHQERILDSFLKVERYSIRHSAFGGGWVGPMNREFVTRPTAVAVLPYDPVKEKILLIEQFRLPAYLAGMPGWLQTIANWNPVSSLTQASRQLFGNTGSNKSVPDYWSLQHPIIYTLVWIALLIAIFVPLSARQYKRAASR